MRTHELKILPEYFNQIKKGLKTAELRLDDRDFVVGDELHLKEFKPRKKEFTGRMIKRRITYITQVRRWINTEENWVILHLGAASMLKV